MKDWSEADVRGMQYAIELAERGAEWTAPNPRVGCVIVNPSGRIIGSGWHKGFGLPHAEIEAFESIDNEDLELLSESTWYVTLEPCSHHGKTPPCATFLANIRPDRLVISTLDPNPNVAGSGAQLLRDAGIQVEIGCLEQASRWQNRRFFHTMLFGMPWVVLKWAESQDGFIDGREDAKRVDGSGGFPITGKTASLLSHRWRALESGILIGARTASIDSPQLNVRTVSGRAPLRFVLDPNGTLEPSHLLFQKTTDAVPAIHILRCENPQQPSYLIWNPESGLRELLKSLWSVYGLTSLLVEGGAHTLNQFLLENQWNELRRWQSNHSLGQGLKAPSWPKSAVEPPFGPSEGYIDKDKWCTRVNLASWQTLKTSTGSSR